MNTHILHETAQKCWSSMPQGVRILEGPMNSVHIHGHVPCQAICMAISSAGIQLLLIYGLLIFLWQDSGLVHGMQCGWVVMGWGHLMVGWFVTVKSHDIKSWQIFKNAQNSTHRLHLWRTYDRSLMSSIFKLYVAFHCYKVCNIIPYNKYHTI